MCKAMEDMRNAAAQDERKRLAKQLLAAGKLSAADISEYFKLTPSEIAALAK